MNQELYTRGLERAKNHDYAGAIADFSAVIQANPYFTDAYVKRGLAYFDLGEYLQAVSDYTEAIKLDGQCIDAFYGRAIARLALKNLPGTLDDAERVIKLDSNYAAAHNLKGIVKRKQGLIHEAIACFKQAAQLYLQAQDTENCRACLERVKRLQPQPVVPKSGVNPVASNSTVTNTISSENDYFLELIVAAERGETQAAMESVNWVLKVDPQDGKAYCCRGVIRCKQGKYQDALADFNQALRLNFNHAITYRNRGKARLHLGDVQGALADFEIALTHEPDNPMSLTARGIAHQSLGNYLQAIQDFSRAIEINPHDAQAYLGRGMVYTRLEEIQKASADYQQASEIFCENDDWQNYQQALDSLKKINAPSPEVRKSNYEKLRQKLSRLVGGHWEIAERYLERAKYYYPGMAEEWYLERVIYELENGDI